MSVESITPVDPRVQIELEKLNTATDDINKYEQILDDSKCEFRKLLEESVNKINQCTQKLGNAIQIAKPYYEARFYATQLVKETQMAAVNYEKAKSHHAAAKEMVYLAEQGLGEKSNLDTACQELLSHAASRVNQSQVECTDTQNILKITELKHDLAQNRVQKLQNQFKSAIKSSSNNVRRKLILMNLLAYQHDLLCLPYYETRANYNGLLRKQNEKIQTYEARVAHAKLTYNEALRNLEDISEEIHKMRKEKEYLKREFANSDIDLKAVYNNADTVVLSSAKSSTYDIKNDERGTFIDYSCNNRHHNYSSSIDTCDEYLDLPPKLSKKSSPIRQRQLPTHDCPHLLHDFQRTIYPTNINCPNSDLFDYDNRSENNPKAPATSIASNYDENEQWSEIPLSKSESTSSGYSPHFNNADDRTPDGAGSYDTSSSDDIRKASCSHLFTGDLYTDMKMVSARRHTEEARIADGDGGGGGSGTGVGGAGSGSGIASWISRSNSIKTSNRRPSLDLLLDASDRVKDAFTSSFQSFGKSLERRNSESEVYSENSDFFSFTTRNERDHLSDEQVENLIAFGKFYEDDLNYIVKGINNISK